MEAHKWLRAALLSSFCLVTVSAADDCSGSTTVSSQADATFLAKACKTYSGSIAIATGIEGVLSLDGLEHIDSLSFENTTQLISIGAPSLKSAGSVYGSDATILSSMDFPRLSAVDGFTLTGMPDLSTFTFTAGVKPTSLLIGETFLSALSGLEPDGEMDEVNVCFNQYLQDITLGATSVDIITIIENGDKVRISFPDLKQAGDIEIGNASNIKFPSLESVTDGGLVIYGGGLKSLDLSSLKEAEDGLYLRDLALLSDLSLPELSNIHRGSLEIKRVGLTNLSLDALESVFSSIWLEGEFDSVSLPKLTEVGGSFFVKGSKNFDCSAFSAQFASSVNFRQSLSCVAGDEETDSQSATTSRHTSSKTESATSAPTAASTSASELAASVSAETAASTASAETAVSAASASTAATSAAVADDSSAASTFGVGMAMTGSVFGTVSLFLILNVF
ncbi:hypothetical protein GTA08_BOTSDO03832 [Neofusicoccum parvum]|uniref:Uncharacterized protein n=1 Tax=Neofusicoccum parvum TaxID=310453 RepID=A0ACB5SN44_9PEZI|nr:hypothetical protein GTA08_BOTSDO03832 [Neofusicoccum parvum]